MEKIFFMQDESIPRSFIARRAHSIFGLFLAIFLFFHLFTNSQAALLIGDDGKGFIHGVNGIHDLPYLPLIELGFLALPILIHAAWGLKYLRTAEYNSFGGDGSTPYLPEYGRNRAYTWQRITSWILLFAIVAHVVQMRFYEAPLRVSRAADTHYLVKVTEDEGLASVSRRLGIVVYKEASIQSMHLGNDEENARFVQAIQKLDIGQGEAVVVATSFGAAELMMLRETFKSPLMMFLYTVFVLAACFHAFNGMWTFCITWGITLSTRSQALMLKATTFLMVLVAFFGLAAIYLTYWVNLRH
jgi:succinate dehydrogenase / fumarate reductase cytochrome b subunit